jgi:ABC-type antimicrobial peptide transport system permease subunit
LTPHAGNARTALLVAGFSLGIGLALAGSRLVASFLFGLSPNDPATVVAAALLFSVGLAAGGIPAWRASRIEPVAALRRE